MNINARMHRLRSRRVTRLLAIPLVAMIVVLPACAHARRFVFPASRPNNAVRWIAAPATPPPTLEATAASTPSNAPECSFNHLKVSSAVVKAAAGTSYFEIGIENTAEPACNVRGVPSVQLFDTQGRRFSGRAVPNGIEGHPAGPLAPGLADAADILIGVRSDCGSSSSSRSLISSVRIMDSRGSSLNANVDRTLADPLCNVMVSTYQSGTVVPAPQSPASARLDLPASAPPGATMVYYVTLTNTGTSPYPTTCPSYEEILSAGGKIWVDAWYTLNCSSGPIAPQQSRTYEMQIQIPSALPEDSDAKISWRIPDPVQDVFAGGRLSICSGC